MKKICMAKDQLQLNRTAVQHSNKMVEQLIEYRAREKDISINYELLKSLVIKYADAEKNLVELNQLKNKFLGMAAHDLRNPLTSIRGFSEILLDGELGPISEEQKEFLGIINTTSNEMLTLLNDLLDISVIESGKLDLQRTMGSLNKIITDRIRINEVIAEKKDMTIHADLDETPELLFDPNRITQVFDNIVSNAIKFSPSGTTVFVTMKKSGNNIKVSVRDEGPGISEEDQSQLFGEFQRLSATPTGGEKSTGLGLSIVKKMVEAHNGTLTVESVVGSGATFSFELPLEIQ